MSEVAENCPQCEAHFVMCSLIERTDEKIRLHCNGCDGRFELCNTKRQRRSLRGQQKYMPSQIDPLRDISQLLPADVIAFKRFKGAYEHHAVVTEVDRESGDVTLVEFAGNSPTTKGSIQRNRKNFDRDIKPANAFVRRHMPLDSRAAGKVIRTANKFADDPKSMPGYDAFANNCQHLASFCKTGVRVSDEGDWYEKLYTFVIKSALIVLSAFENPYVKIGQILIMGAAAYRQVRKEGIQRAIADRVDFCPSPPPLMLGSPFDDHVGLFPMMPWDEPPIRLSPSLHLGLSSSGDVSLGVGFSVSLFPSLELSFSWLNL